MNGWEVEPVSLTSSRDAATSALRPLTDLDPGELGRLSPSVVLALRKRVAEFEPHIVLASGGATLRYGVLALLGKPVKLAYIGIGEPEYWLRSELSRRVNRWFLRRTDAILAVSRMTAAQIEALEPSVADRVYHAPTGVPEEFFELDSDDQSGGPIRIAVIGSLSHEKDPGMALRALAQLPEGSLRFVGDGPLRAELSAMASDFGVADRVEFAGSTTDVMAHLRWADVLMLTSRTEGLPGVVLEAGAAGVPAVAVDVGGVSEAIGDGAGLLVDRQEEQVVEALRALAGDSALVARLGNEAKRYVSSAYSMSSAVDRYVAVLTEVLE